MGRGGVRRIVPLFVLSFAVCAGVAGLARWRLDRAHPFAPAGWWRPREVAPAVDPELLARASRERRALAAELAERRARLRPAPERLRGATAVAQVGHAGPVTALAWRGNELFTAGEDGTLRTWVFDGRRLRERRATALPGTATALALAAGGGGVRVWSFAAPDRLVVREGAELEIERVRAVPAGRALGLAAADEGQRAVLLLERRGSDGARRLAVRHYVEPETVLLKEVALAGIAAPAVAALSPDGERVAVVVRDAAGPAVELRRSADGAPAGRVALAAPWWTAEAPGPWGEPTLGWGNGFLAVGDGGGLMVVPTEAAVAAGSAGVAAGSAGVAAGSAAAAAAFPGGPSVSGGAGGADAGGVGEVPKRVEVLAVCDSALVASGPGGASVLRRGAEGWRVEAAGAAASGAACTAGGTVAALARGEALEVRSPAGVEAAGAAARLSGASWAGGGSQVALRWVNAAGRTVRSSFDLAEWTVSSAEGPGEPAAADAASGDLLWSTPDGWRIETSAGVAAWVAAEGMRPAAMRGGVVAGLVEARDRVVLQERSGAVLGAWPVPGWLGIPRVTLCGDGRTVVATGAGGFSAWRAGHAGPLVEFPGEGYEEAPGEVSLDGRTVLVGRADGVVEEWGIESWEVERAAPAMGGLGGRPTVIRWGADGEVLYVGGSRGGVAALQGRTRNPLWGALVHEGPVTVLEPAPSGAWLLSADARTAALTAARGGERLVRLAVGPDGSWAAFTEDGYHAAGGPGGERLLALRLPPGEAGAVGAMVSAEDDDFGRLGGATDALRATLLGASAAEPEP